MSVIDTLVTDRTQAHVDRLKYLSEKGWDNLTPDEKGEWRYGPPVPMVDESGEQFTDANGELLWCRGGVQRGSYGAQDLNRVGEAMIYIAGRLRSAGYAVSVSPRVDWTNEEWVTPTAAAHLLADLAALRSAFALTDEAPEVPEDMEGFTFAEANDIEKILQMVDGLLTNITAAWFYSGDLYSGEV